MIAHHLRDARERDAQSKLANVKELYETLNFLLNGLNSGRFREAQDLYELIGEKGVSKKSDFAELWKARRISMWRTIS